MKKTTQFRNLLQSDQLEFICEAHNALSARIVEEAGFRGVWGSSLTMSASMGVRDNNEASWTQVLDVAEFITDATSIPLLLDADTGYGDFNSVRRLVKKLEQRDVSAMCIEDKLFPKKNSFISSERQPLADIDEFAGKIKAAKDTQTDPDFSVLARVEAFIAGWGLGEAMKRAEAYHKAGADGILIHSKISRPDEVLSFMKEWGDRSPVIIVPTKYYTTPTEVFQQAGFSIVIWANMILRSAIKAMRQTAEQIGAEESVINIEDDIVPVSEIFRLQRAEEFEEAEKLYLPGLITRTQAVILAAAQGAELGPLTEDIPKALIPIAGKPLLFKQIETLNEIGIKDITVVRGFNKEAIDAPNLDYVDNDEYAGTQEVYSLFKGIQGIEGKTLIAYGDILYKKFIPSMLLEADGDFVVPVDVDWKSSKEKGRYTDFVSCDQPYQRNILDQKCAMTKMGTALPDEDICGEWIGLLKLSSHGLSILQGTLADLSSLDNFKQVRMADLFNELIKRGHEIKVLYVRGHWVDVDDIKDLSAAGAF
jgi:phosphoenolpyruvate phosphomutase